MRSYRPENGELLWEINASGRTSTTPVGDEELLYVDSYDRMMGGRGSLMAIRPGANGSISLKAGDATNSFVAWSIPQSLFRVASPWANNGRVFCLDREGVTVVIQSGPELKILGTNKLDGMFWASAATIGGNLLLRDVDGLYHIGKEPRN